MSAHDWFLLGAPWDCSGTGRGEQHAPTALRAAGLGSWAGRDVGDAATAIAGARRDTRTGVVALEDTVVAAKRLGGALASAMRSEPGRRPLVVGGDCSLLLGVFAALPRRTGLWFVDGHPDYLDGAASDTGETADMDLALLHGTGARELVGLGSQRPLLRIADTVLIGHRTHRIDDASAVELARLPAELARHDADEVCADPAGTGRAAAERLGDVPGGVWLHVDLDVLDPASLPAVTYPQPGGPDWAQLAALLEPLVRSPRLIGVSVADFRPDLDPDGSCARRIAALLTDLLA